MKKNVLALSISAALCGLGMVGSAHAVTDLGVAASVGAATELKANNDGIGHNLIIPYYSTQGGNVTAITLTNTTAKAKAVKVRFRGAENSDDVLDFQVFLSPYDVWTAGLSLSADGYASIKTDDKSCTKPAFPAGPVKFLTSRLSSETNAAGTREGYVEIFNMADIATGSTLETAVTHVAGTPAGCDSAAFKALDTDKVTADFVAAGLTLPTTGLTANYILINTTTGTSWSGSASATQALAVVGGALQPATGNLVYWPQKSDLATTLTAGVAGLSGWTADPLLIGAAPIIPPTQQDLPDMSTPYISGLSTNAGVNFNAVGAYAAANDQFAAKNQSFLLTQSLAVQSVSNDFYASATIGGATDWAFTMPTRRYHVAVKYAGGPTIASTDYTLGANGAGVNVASVGKLNFFKSGAGGNAELAGNVICITGVSVKAFNREEGTKDITTSTTFSPSTANPAISFCGEAGVWALGQEVDATGSAVLGSNISRVVQGVPVNSYAAGWLNVATPGLTGLGLPVVGASFSKASSDPAKTYGWNQPHAATRATTYNY